MWGETTPVQKRSPSVFWRSSQNETFCLFNSFQQGTVCTEPDMQRRVLRNQDPPPVTVGEEPVSGAGPSHENPVVELSMFCKVEILVVLSQQSLLDGKRQSSYSWLL